MRSQPHQPLQKQKTPLLEARMGHQVLARRQLLANPQAHYRRLVRHSLLQVLELLKLPVLKQFCRQFYGLA
ncbi:MAG: hypothetical protein LH660_00075 [Phormidesmis sp. CAN_BIN36]|nr:hypothetical protein [Phormidesmis sp. CAN_BIN36]